MCNRARFDGEPETITERFGAAWLEDKPMDNRFDPKELRPFGRAYVVRNVGDRRRLDVMEWDVLAGQAKLAGRKVAQTNVRTLHLPQWRSLVSDPACGSAWKKDPGSGVIGVEKGPLIPLV